MKSSFRARLGVWLALLLLALCYVLKLHYSRANTGELVWILQPTVLLVGLSTGQEFACEPIGFVNTELGIVVTKACAGVNFMIMVLMTLALGQIEFDLDPCDRIVWCAMLVPIAFVGTVLVNGARILLMTRIGADHLLLGVVIYTTALVLLHLAARVLLGKRQKGTNPCVA